MSPQYAAATWIGIVFAILYERRTNCQQVSHTE